MYSMPGNHMHACTLLMGKYHVKTSLTFMCDRENLYKKTCRKSALRLGEGREKLDLTVASHWREEERVGRRQGQRESGEEVGTEGE